MRDRTHGATRVRYNSKSVKATRATASQTHKTDTTQPRFAGLVARVIAVDSAPMMVAL